PQKWYAALKQRTRWVMGIALQGWQRYGWRGTPGEVYWLWRDRKGLVANPLGLGGDFVLVYGAAAGLWARRPATVSYRAAVTICLQVLRSIVRIVCVARIYGFLFSLGVPLRAIYANALNSAATFLAVWRYASARIRGQRLSWLKTDHHFPSRAAL